MSRSHRDAANRKILKHTLESLALAENTMSHNDKLKVLGQVLTLAGNALIYYQKQKADAAQRSDENLSEELKRMKALTQRIKLIRENDGK